MKKISIVLAVAVAIVALSVSVAAATDINANEQKIVDAVAKVHTVNDGELSIPDATQNQVSLYLMRDGVDLTEEEADYIVEKIEACYAIVEAAGVSDFDAIRQLPGDKKTELLDLAREAAQKIGLTVAYNAADHSLTVADAAGKEVATVSTDLKFTGEDNTAWIVTAICIAALLCGGFAVAKKARLFA